MNIDDQFNRFQERIRAAEERYAKVTEMSAKLAPKTAAKKAKEQENRIIEKARKAAISSTVSANVSLKRANEKLNSLQAEISRIDRDFFTGGSLSAKLKEPNLSYIGKTKRVTPEQIKEEIKVTAYDLLLRDQKSSIKLISGDSYNIRVLLQDALESKTERLKRTLKFKSTPNIIKDFSLTDIVNEDVETSEKKLDQVRKYSVAPYTNLKRKEIILLTYAIAYFESNTEDKAKDEYRKAGKLLFFMKKMSTAAYDVDLIDKSFDLIYEYGDSPETLRAFGSKVSSYFNQIEDDLYIEYMDNPIMPSRSSYGS